MEILLEGKPVSENIRKNFGQRIKRIEEENGVTPCISVLGIKRR